MVQKKLLRVDSVSEQFRWQYKRLDDIQLKKGDIKMT